MFSSTVQDGQSGIGCIWMLHNMVVPKFSFAFGRDGGQTHKSEEYPSSNWAFTMLYLIIP